MFAAIAGLTLVTLAILSSWKIIGSMLRNLAKDRNVVKNFKKLHEKDNNHIFWTSFFYVYSLWTKTN